jgi:type IV secretory pathway VirB10-like protein
MNTTLVFGVLLIVAGIALAILAYALILNRRSESPAGADGTEPEAELVVPPPSTPAEPTAIPAALPPTPQAQPAALPPTPQAQPAAVPPTLQAQPSAPATPPPPPRTIDVGRLLRDEVSGALLIAVGPRLYRTVDELRSSDDWLRMEKAAGELQVWFAAPPKPKPIEERRSEEAASRAGSMLDQINAILERKLALVPALPQGIRLAPSPEGGVRVLIGLQAYALDQVPDPRINQLIRESVSEWESRG